jgi:predicted ester cyclase
VDAQTMKRTGLTAIECFNDPARRAEYFDVLYDDAVALHGYTPEPLVGKPAVRAFYDQIWAAFPDAQVATDAMYVDGDHLTWRFRFGGTHAGDFLGVPGTGRSVEIDGITVLRFGSGRCVERWSVSDFLALLVQIGALSPANA